MDTESGFATPLGVPQTPSDLVSTPEASAPAIPLTSRESPVVSVPQAEPPRCGKSVAGKVQGRMLKLVLMTLTYPPEN